MQKIKTGMVSYLSGRDTVSAYLAVPYGNGSFPALIVIHEWWGLNDWIKKNTNDFADRGYVALAIDLYRGKSTSLPAEARKLSGSVPQERVSTDLISAYDYLRNMNEVTPYSIGSIGWCMGGGYSLRAAIDIPGLTVCVINYGRLVADTKVLKKINCPILGIFGAEDRNITPTDVKSFEKSLTEASIKNKITIYPDAGHAFMNPNNTNLYNKTVAEKAWDETYSFLNNNLKQTIE